MRGDILGTFAPKLDDTRISKRIRHSPPQSTYPPDIEMNSGLGHLVAAKTGIGLLFCRFPKPQARPPHLFEQPNGLHDSIKADGRRSGASPDIASQVLVGRSVDAQPGANQITDGFGLELANDVR